MLTRWQVPAVVGRAVVTFNFNAVTTDCDPLASVAPVPTAYGPTTLLHRWYNSVVGADHHDRAMRMTPPGMTTDATEVRPRVLRCDPKFNCVYGVGGVC